MADHQAEGWRWGWPQGIANRILLLLWLALFVLRAEDLLASLFFGRQASFSRPWGYDVAVRAVYLAFMLALVLIPYSRQRYRLLLPAHMLDGLSDLVHSTILWLPVQWLLYAPAIVGLLSCAAAALWIVALVRGERWDEFIFTAPLTLLAVIFRRGRRGAGNDWPPTLGSVLQAGHSPEAAGGHPEGAGGD